VVVQGVNLAEQRSSLLHGGCPVCMQGVVEGIYVTRVYARVKGNLNKAGQELEPETNLCASTKTPGLEDEYMRLKKDA
jgi:hypothetical protein